MSQFCDFSDHYICKNGHPGLYHAKTKCGRWICAYCIGLEKHNRNKVKILSSGWIKYSKTHIVLVA